MIDVNPAALTLYGYSRERFLGLTELDICAPEEAAEHDAVRRRGAVSPPESRSRVWRHLTADGRQLWVRMYASAHALRDRPVWLVTLLDVSDEVRTREELQRTRGFLDAIVDNIPAMLFVKEARDLRFVLVNKAAEAHMRCRRQDLIGRNNLELLPTAEAQFYNAIDHEALRSGKMHVSEGRFQTSDMGERIMRTTTIVLKEHGESQYVIGISEDVTERRADEARIAYLAHHDALTGLANRVLLCERLEVALEGVRRRGGLAAVLYVDLDRFKDVNDSLGHRVGDELLSAVATRLQRHTRDGQIVSRQGGDEFTVLIPEVDSPESVQNLSAEIITALGEPFMIDGHEVQIGASVGIAIAPQDGTSADLLLRNADMALYRAKSGGRGITCFFEPEMNARLQARRQLERDLRKAFAAGILQLHFQPLLTVDASQITGFEALLRWPHAERGFISPVEFIPVAEEIGLIGPLGDWVLRAACREATSWPAPVRVAVNVSPLQFRRGDLFRSVAAALDESGLRPDRLELEITESVLMDNTEANLATLVQIRHLGVRIAMDDFGTGYSSLSYLRSFPFDKIKIDRSFIQELGDSAESGAIIRAVAGLGASLGMTVTAEGVETAAQLARLRAEGCSELQGFLFSRPVPAGEVQALIAGVGSVKQVA